MPAYARHLLAGLASMAMVFAAAAMWLFDSATAAGFSFRVAILLAALWFAWPEITQRSPRRLVIGAAAAVAVLVRPRSAWILIPAFLFWLAMARR